MHLTDAERDWQWCAISGSVQALAANNITRRGHQLIFLLNFQNLCNQLSGGGPLCRAQGEADDCVCTREHTQERGGRGRRRCSSHMQEGEKGRCCITICD